MQPLGVQSALMHQLLCSNRHALDVFLLHDALDAVEAAVDLTWDSSLHDPLLALQPCASL